MSEYALRLDAGEVARYRMMAEAARGAEAAEWAAAGIGPGARVADVGCGPGAVLTLLAKAVGAEGRAVGVDAEPSTVAHAAGEVAGLPQAEVREGRAEATGLDPGSFDVVMCRHVLAHNGPREAEIVAHLAGLARPGGTVYLVDVDLTAARFVPTDTGFDLIDRYREFHAAQGNDLQVGVRLGALLEGAGLTVEAFRCSNDVMRLPPGMRPPVWAARHAMLAAGVITEADVARWEAAFVDLDAMLPRPWVFIPVFVAIGRRPD